MEDEGEGKGECKDKKGPECFLFGDWIADAVTNREVWRKNTFGTILNHILVGLT